MRQDFVGRQQLSLLPERIRMAQRADATEEAYRVLGDLLVAKGLYGVRRRVLGEPRRIGAEPRRTPMSPCGQDGRH